MEPDYIKLDSIATNPDNPREDLSQEGLETSLEAFGMQQPIIIRPVTAEDKVKKSIKFIVVDGDCRLESMLRSLPGNTKLTIGDQVVIRELTRKQAYLATLQANFLRKDFTLKEECEIVQKLIDEKYSYRRIKEILGKSIGWVHERIDFITKATEDEKEEVLSGETSLREWSRPEVFAGEHLDEEPSKTPLLDKYRPGADGALKQTIAIEGPEDGPMQSITKPPKFLCPTQFFDDLQKAFPKVKFLDVKMVGAFTGFNVYSEDAETRKKIIDLMQAFNQEAKQEAKFEKSKASEEHRTTRFTEDQFAAIEIESAFEDEIHSYQIIGNERTIIWKSFKSKMDALKWLLDHKAEFPLTRWQLEKYTDLSQDEIQKLVEDSIQQEAEERVETKPEGPVKEAWAFISKQEHDSLIPSIKALITAEEPVPEAEQRYDRSMQLFFSSWEDEAILQRWIKPSRDHLEAILDFPASIFMASNLKDILIDDKQLKEHFPNVYQELKQLQKFTKNIKQKSLRSMEEITKAAKRLEVFMREIDLDLQHLKKTRRISGSEEQHLRICQKCLQPKWLSSKRDLCGNCEVSNNKQNKKAAASSSGGQQ